MSRIAVIGGGAAGMLCSAYAARAGHQVTVLEQNEKLGKKLYITGKGRCNLTNDCEVEELLQAVVTNGKFLYSAFYGYTSRDAMDFFTEIGVPLKVERGNRVFPVSDRSSDVIRGLERELGRLGVEVRLHTRAESLWIEEGVLKGVILSGDERLLADKVVVSTGGLSYPSTGATGDGYRLAESVGHQVTKLRPSLVPILVEEEFIGELAGLSLKNTGLTVYRGKKRIFQDFGEMLFTHQGVTGPMILSASARAGEALLEEPLRAELDLKPARTHEQLHERILREFEQAPNKQVKNVIGGLYPASLTPVMLRRAGIQGEKKVHDVTREERTRLVELTKAFTLTLTGLGTFKEAVVTRGGVSVKEIDPGTMESKRVPGLYFIGEVLDLDGLTGGYNLQIAWSTAHAAALAL